jgi:DNA-directed RNA polymerase alpha subunit
MSGEQSLIDRLQRAVRYAHIDALPLSRRTRNALVCDNHIEEVSALLCLTPEEVLALRQLGPTGLEDVRAALAELGLALKGEAEPAGEGGE